MRRLLCAMLLIAPMPVGAFESDYGSYVVVPSAPAADTPFALKLTSVFACVHGATDAAEIDVAGRIIRYTFRFREEPCPEANASPKTVPMPGLPRARYRLEWWACSENPPPPLPECEMFAVEEFDVGGALRAVPASSARSIAVLGCAIVLLAGLAWRAEHRQITTAPRQKS